MKRHLRLLPFVGVSAALLALALAAPVSWADRVGSQPVGTLAGRGEEEAEAELEFDEAHVFFELNHTDGDLGIHALVDGEAWKLLIIETPRGQENLRIQLSGSLRRQGLTELFFESAEPTFDELLPEAFFRRFPEGEYEIEGVTVEGDAVESTVDVTHLLPAPPGNFSVNGMALPESCENGPAFSTSEPFNVSWDPVSLSHPDLGRTGEPIDVDKYELILEREEPTLLKFSIDLPPGVTSVQIPGGLTSSGEQIKIEILVREAGGNQTAIESCFEVN